MAKTLKHNMAHKPSPKLRTIIYKDLFTGQQRPVPEYFVEQTAQELLQWAINDKEALTLTEFIRSKGIPRMTFYDWVKKYPYLAQAKAEAMQALADRREKGAIMNRYNANMILKRQYRYDHTWWEDEERRAKLKADTQPQAQSDVTYKIIVDSYKDDDDKPTNNMPETE